MEMFNTNRVCGQFLLCLFMCMFIADKSYARRRPPAEVPPVRYEGYLIKSVQSLSKDLYGTEKDGAFIKVCDAKTGKLLWWLQVYTITYNKRIEMDVQFVHIASCSAKDGKITITNEVGMSFEVDIKTKSTVLESSPKTIPEGIGIIEVGGKWGIKKISPPSK